MSVPYGDGLMHLRPVERNVVLGLLAIIVVGLLAVGVGNLLH
jgi:hypothetical protein